MDFRRIENVRGSPDDGDGEGSIGSSTFGDYDPDFDEQLAKEEEQERTLQEHQENGGEGSIVAAGPAPRLGAGGKEIISITLPVGCLQAVFHLLIGRFLFVEDNFTQLVRKCTLTVFLMGSLPVFMQGVLTLGIYQSGWWGYEAGHWPDIVAGIAMMTIGTVFFIDYIVLCVKRHVSDRTIFVSSLVITQAMFAFNFCTTAANGLHLCWVSVACVLVLESPGKFKMIAILFVIGLLTFWNDAYENVPGTFIFRPDAVRRTTGIEVILMMINSSLPASCVLIPMFLAMQDQKRQVRIAKKSAALAHEMVEELRSYRTEKVRDLVQVAQKDDESNPELLESFAAMVDNMEQYRPYLPNFLFMEGQDGDEEDGQGGDKPSDKQQSTPRGSQTGLATSVGSAPSSPPAGGHRSIGGDVQAVQAVTPTLQGWVLGGPDGPETAPMMTPSAQPGGAAPSNHHKGLISFVWLECQSTEWYTRSSRTNNTVQAHRQSHSSAGNPLKPHYAVQKGAAHAPRAPTMTHLALFTDALYTIAKSNKGSVHGMVGDMVQLSWNATAFIAQPEAKAVNFLLRLRDSLATAFANSSVQVNGACASGVADVHSIFSPATKQHALYLAASWQPALQACYDLAVKHRALVIDANTESACEYDVVTQAVDCIRYQPRVSADLLSAVGPGAKAYPELKPRFPGLPSEALTTGHYQSLLSCDPCAAHQDPAQDPSSQVPSRESSRSSYNSNDSNSRRANSVSQTSIRTGAPTSQTGASFSSGSPFRYTLAFELREKKDGVADDEWMYQLAAHETAKKDTREARVTNSLFQILDEKYLEAGNLLSTTSYSLAGGGGHASSLGTGSGRASKSPERSWSGSDHNNGSFSSRNSSEGAIREGGTVHVNQARSPPSTMSSLVVRMQNFLSKTQLLPQPPQHSKKLQRRRNKEDPPPQAALASTSSVAATVEISHSISDGQQQEEKRHQGQARTTSSTPSSVGDDDDEPQEQEPQEQQPSVLPDFSQPAEEEETQG